MPGANGADQSIIKEPESQVVVAWLGMVSQGFSTFQYALNQIGGEAEGRAVYCWGAGFDSVQHMGVLLPREYDGMMSIQ
jgi:hypothetical protein